MNCVQLSNCQHEEIIPMMSSKQAKNGEQLRQKIKRAGDGETISLEAGEEFLGPFVLDKPITLVGQGKQSPLHGQGLPAVIVLSPGVRLMQLELFDAFDPESGISLLTARDTQPELIDININGQAETMTKESVVDIGNILPKEVASTYMEVEVAGVSNINCVGKWLNVHPPQLSRGGKHLIQLYCDSKYWGTDVVAIGKIEIITGAKTQVFWVTAKVQSAIPSKLVKEKIALSLGKQRLRFAKGFLLGKNKFPGVRGADTMADRQAFLLKEPSGTWAVFQPWRTISPTLVNGNELAWGQRFLLKEGDTIRAGKLDLKVEKFPTEGDYSVNKGVIDFGTTGSLATDTNFQVRNNGSRVATTKFVSTVPWITVRPAETDIKRKDIIDVQSSVTREVNSLSEGKHMERGAILVIGKKETLYLDAGIEVLPRPAIDPKVSGDFNFGVVTDWQKASSQVTVTNQGTQEWKPAVKADQDWLSPDKPSLNIPPGQSTVLKLHLNQKVEPLGPKNNLAGQVTLDGDGTSEDIKVKAQLNLAVSKPVTETTLLDFGELDEWAQANPGTLVVRNDGDKDWLATIRTNADWLDIPEKTFTIPAKKRKSLIVKLNGNIPVGIHTVKNAIVIDGDGHSLSVQADVTLKEPSAIIRIFPQTLDFGEFSRWESAPPQSTTIQNKGAVEWIGTINCKVPWLDITPSGKDIHCAPKSDSVLTLKINDKIPEGTLDLPDTITLDGLKESFKIQVRARFTPQPQIRCSTRSLDFGEVNNSKSAQKKSITFFNDGNKDGMVTISPNDSVLWVAVNERSLKVPQGGQAKLEVYLAEPLDRLPAGYYKEPDAIILTGDISGHIQVSVALPDFQLDANPKKISFSIEEKKSSGKQIVKIRNIGPRDWNGTVKAQVPWLSVEPAQLDIKVGGQSDVSVQITDTVFGSETDISDAIVFEGIPLTVDIYAKVQREDDLSARFDPPRLDFEPIEEVAGSQQLSLGILVDQDWDAPVHASEDWFEASVDRISCRAGKQVSIKIHLTDKAQDLTTGIHWGNLHIGPFQIPARLEKAETFFDVVVNPSESAFVIEPGGNIDQSQTIEVINKNDKAWDVSVEATESWLSAPSPFQLPPSGKIELDIGLSQQTLSLSEGSYRGEIILSAGDQVGASHQVNLRVGEPQWAVEKQFVFMGKVEKSEDAWINHNPELIEINNLGNENLELVVKVNRGGEWLDVRDQLVLRPNRSQELRLSLKLGAWETCKLGRHKGEIELAQGAYRKHIMVDLQIIGPSAPIDRIFGRGEVVTEEVRQPKSSKTEEIRTGRAFDQAPDGEKPVEVASDTKKYAKKKESQPVPSSKGKQTSNFGKISKRTQTNVNVSPLVIDFGEIKDWKKAASHDIAIKNNGDQMVLIVASSPADWLKISPQSLTCPGEGFSKTIEVALKHKGAFPPLGPLKSEVNITVDGEAFTTIHVVGESIPK